MIYTITLNPTIDYIVTVPHLNLGHSHHMEEELITPGGKGIMVSRVLKALGIPSIALGFRGGFTGDFVRDYLEEMQIINQFTVIKERTRINLVLKSDQDTEISDYGPAATDEEVAVFMKCFEDISTQDFVVLSGSKLPSMPKDFYERLIRSLHEEGVPFACDITKDELRNSLQYHPLAVKPNQNTTMGIISTRRGDPCGRPCGKAQGSPLPPMIEKICQFDVKVRRNASSC